MFVWVKYLTASVHRGAFEVQQVSLVVLPLICLYSVLLGDLPASPLKVIRTGLPPWCQGRRGPSITGVLGGFLNEDELPSLLVPVPSHIPGANTVYLLCVFVPLRKRSFFVPRYRVQRSPWGLPDPPTPQRCRPQPTARSPQPTNMGSR